MKKVSFYLMNEKGFYLLKNFIKDFNSNNIKYVISSKDSNVQKDYFIEIKVLCENNNILFFNKTDNFSNEETSFQGYKFAIGWRWIIKNDKKLIVFHDSILPKYRGFAPLVNSLIVGEKLIGVTALFADKDYDKGNIILQESIGIEYPITINEAISKVKPLYYTLMKNIYTIISQNKILHAKKQDENSATYSMWLDEKDYFIDWENWHAEKIKRFVDAVGYPYDNAKSYLNNDVISFISVEVIDDIIIKERTRHIGKVIFMENEVPSIVCKKGLIRLIKLETKKGRIRINFRSRFY